MRCDSVIYKAFIFLFLHGTYLFSSQQSTKSLDLLRSIKELWLVEHEKHILYSSRDMQKGFEQRQLIVRLKSDENKIQSFSCFRLDSDTLLLLSAQTKNNERIVFTSSSRKGDSENQLNSIDAFFKKLPDSIKDVKVLVLNCENDAGISFTDKAFWENYKTQLQQNIGVEPIMISYSMVRGQDFREKDHFECRIDRKKVIWRSAIDGFQEHSL